MRLMVTPEERATLQGVVDSVASAFLKDERERCAQIVEAEPECLGYMPDELYDYPLEDLIRAAVRATKQNIARAIRALK